jgi:hypothetical protein
LIAFLPRIAIIMIMNASKILLVSAALFPFFALKTQAQAPTDDRQMFAFKFQTNQPLIYAISITTRSVTDNNIGGKTSLQSNTRKMHYNARLTGYKNNPDGTALVFFKPYRIEEDADNSGLSHIATQIRDLKIKSQQNGIVTIDTENNVGMGQANSIKISVYPMMLSGYFKFDPTGRILEFQGDLPFSDYWTEVLKAQLGFFSIFFPSHPVGIREGWTENISMNYSSGATLENPLTITNTFTREPDLMTNGNSVATFSITSGDHLQNISGYFEQNGQKSSLNISQFDHNAFGTFHFDRKRGILLDSNTKDTGEISMNMLVQGNTATSHVNITTETQISLITDPIDPNQK